VNAWIEPRFTADVDITIVLTAETSRQLTAAFERAGLAQTTAHGAGQPSGPDFVRFASPDRLLAVEFQAAKTGFQRELVQRAASRADGLQVATPEDLIILKLIANRAKDRLDLLGLLQLPGIDWPYVTRWAREWEVDSLLAELRAQVAG
jgi:hypothetical protein